MDGRTDGRTHKTNIGDIELIQCNRYAVLHSDAFWGYRLVILQTSKWM